MRRLSRFLMLCMVMFLLTQIRAGQGQASVQSPQPAQSISGDTQHILFLNTYQIGLPIPDSIERGFLAGLREGGGSVKDLFIQRLDFSRVPDHDYRVAVADFLRHKLAGRHIGLVIAEGIPAVDFIATEGKEFLPEVPMITLITPNIDSFQGDAKKIIDISWRTDVAGTLNIALTLFPRTRRVLVVTGGRDSILPFLEEAKKAFVPWKETLDFEYTNEMTYEQMLQRISSLPTGSIVFYSPYFSDTTGRSFVPIEVIDTVCKLATAPVFSTLEPFLGHGIVGGSLLKTESMGEQAAKITLDYMTGHLKFDKPITAITVPTQKMFDWKVLARWKVNISALPYNSIIINRPPTLWSQYKKEVVTAVIVFLALSCITILLCIVNRRMKLLAVAASNSKAHYQSLFENSLIGVVVTDVNLIFTDANEAFCKMLGYSKEEVIGKMTTLNITHPDDVRISREMVNKLIRHDLENYSLEKRYISKTGKTIKALIYAKGLYNPDNTCKKITASILDITDRMQAEEERDQLHISLRQRAVELDTIFSVLPYLISLHGKNGEYLRVNPTIKKIFGFDPTQTSREETAQRLKARFPDGQPLTPKNMFSTFVLGGKEIDKTEYIITDADGNDHVLLFNGIPWVVDGEVRGAVFAQEDITEGKKTEAALRESEEKYRTLFNNAEIAMFRSRLDGSQTLDVNQKFLDLTGKTREETIGKPSATLWADPKEREEMVRRLVVDGSVSEYEYRMLNKDKGVRNCITSLRLYRDQGILEGSIIDITERKQAEQERERIQAQLVQAQKMEAIGTLAGGIAHDFNNILGAIIGYSEMAEDDSPPGSMVKQDIAQVLKASFRAKELVKQILAFSRHAETQRISLQPAVIIKEAIKMLRSSLPTTIDIKLDIDPESGNILADPIQVHQILVNLCTNAFHAMEETGGTLSLSLKKISLSLLDLPTTEAGIQPGDFVHLSIEDTGKGIDPEIHDKIFNPYFTTKEVGKGTGMGLAIIHGIVKSYGGFLTFDSQPGEGTIFHVFLPVVPDAPQPEATATDLVPFGTEHILFVDDEEILAEMGKHLLERLGYRVTVKNSSVEALSIFQSAPNHFDLVITDQTMPNMTGFDIARRMLQIRPGMPIILCTGYSSQISEDKVRSYGIKGFALKPLAKKDIAVLIRKLLDEEKIVS